MVKYWLDNLPISHDVEEAQVQYLYVSEFLTTTPDYILNGGDITTICDRLARIFGEAFQEKYFTDDNKAIMSQAVKVLINQAPENVKTAFTQMCQNVLSEAHRSHIESAYKFV